MTNGWRRRHAARCQPRYGLRVAAHVRGLLHAHAGAVIGFRRLMGACLPIIDDAGCGKMLQAQADDYYY